MNNNIRTDLALEAREIYEESEKNSNIPGVEMETKELENCIVTKVEIIDEKGSEIMGKGIGKYVTLESNLMKFDDDESREQIIKYLKDELVEIFGTDKTKKTLVIGLGNWNITSDALGPKSVSKTLVTRHIFKNYNKDYDDDFTEVAGLSPGVMGITGIETSEIVKSIVDKIKPDRVVAIDALASRKMERVNATIQISTAGISPGGGVGNKRKALNKDYLGVDVVAIGVPTVVDAATLANDVLDLAIDNLISQSEETESFYNVLKQLKEEEKYLLIKDSLDPYDKNLIVTPKDIDDTIENLSIIISEGLNRSLHPGRDSE
ncbi:GPR endopeptidase [Asaccharospora irregularis]|uniref:Germination protease n=1 Tax=Asaccharospora irregularis DSM 2635 TaxID=1121321 RepID=A0A1M5M496_9FIRM|nr:GPR endopeptidase [Asaccharospora irregularis]SHG72134.1 spore protease [Asaccharospora irregularis DSM 2635]